MALAAPQGDDLRRYVPGPRARRAVMVVDVVESVRLVEADEEGFLSRWLGFVERVKEAILPDCAGRLVKGLGDGLLIAFNDARSAAAAAFAIQRAKAEENAARPDQPAIQLRIGVEIGDVVLDGDDVYGRDVNRAARLLTAAGPGETVVSVNVRDQLTADLDADLEDLGECYLRHVPAPVRVFRVGPPGPTPVIEPGQRTLELLPSLAILPFTCRNDSDEDYVLGDILAEELIRDLSRSPDVSVISRLSTMAFRDREANLPEIGARLNASYVLSGRYRTSGQRLVVDAELAEARTGQVVWSHRLSGSKSDLVSGGGAMLDDIGAGVSAAVLARELRRAQSFSAATLESYTLLLGAVALMHRGSWVDFERARGLLDALIDRAGREAVPLAWLAKWHVLRVQQGWSTDERAEAAAAQQSARLALEADPHCTLALTMDGLVNTHLAKRLDVAEARYAQAIAANPSDPLAWLLKGTLHAFRGEGQQAVADTQKALQLSPLDPHRYYYDSLAASAFISAEDYEAALLLARRSLRANRSHTSTLRVQVVAQVRLGMLEDARVSAQNLLALEPGLTVGRWLQRSPSGGYAVGRNFADALREAGVPP